MAISVRVVPIDADSGPCRASAKVIRSPARATRLSTAARSSSATAVASAVPPWSSSSFLRIEVPYANTVRIGSSRWARTAASPCSGVLMT